MTAIAKIPELESLRLPKTIDQLQSRVMKRFHEFLREHNEAQKLGLGANLRTPHIKAFEAIMYKYLPMFRGMVNSPIWADSNEVPTLLLTRRELSALCGCKSRNAYNLLARLAKAGLLLVEQKLEQSPQMANVIAGYSITPNLWLTSGLEEMRPDLIIFDDVNDIIPQIGVRQSLPDKNNLEIINNSNKAENVDLHEGRHQGINRGKEENEPPLPTFQETLDLVFTKEEKNSAAVEMFGVEKNETPDFEVLANQRVQSKRDKFFGKEKSVPVAKKVIVLDTITDSEKKALIQQFWNYAEANLYYGTNYKGDQLADILRVIYSDVFGYFHGHGDYIYWKSFMLQRLAEVDMMVAHNQKYARQPFTPKCYFAKKYAKKGGFLSAYQWTKKVRKKHQDFKAEELLTRARHSLLISGPPRGQKHKITSVQGLVEYWAKRISQATNAHQLTNYYNFVSQTNLTKVWNNN